MHVYVHVILTWIVNLETLFCRSVNGLSATDWKLLTIVLKLGLAIDIKLDDLPAAWYMQILLNPE